MSKKTQEEIDLDAREEARALWLEQSYTRILRRQLLEQEIVLLNHLLGVASVSTDAEVRGAAMRLASARQFREHFEPRAEKVENDDESK